jgi:hypothetical protein
MGRRVERTRGCREGRRGRRDPSSPRRQAEANIVAEDVPEVELLVLDDGADLLKDVAAARVRAAADPGAVSAVTVGAVTVTAATAEEAEGARVDAVGGGFAILIKNRHSSQDTKK